MPFGAADDYQEMQKIIEGLKDEVKKLLEEKAILINHVKLLQETVEAKNETIKLINVSVNRR